MRVAVTGANGLLGRQVIMALEANQHTPIALTHRQFDITDFSATCAAIAHSTPDLVIHCAAMTHVDRCALEPDTALHINGYGTHNVALACRTIDIPIAYISSNEVFDGSRAAPYLEYDQTTPANPYGYSKWAGEQAIRDVQPRHYIIRTSWLFAHGGDNFLHKLVRMAAQGTPISVVTNEVAAPTYANDLAEAVIALIGTERYGIYHLVNEGHASRYQFARHILDVAGCAHVPIAPILDVQRPRPSHPPVYSTLRNFAAARLGITLRPWQEAVQMFFTREAALTRATVAEPERVAQAAAPTP